MELGQGELFVIHLYKNSPWILTTGGSKGELGNWDTEENEEVKKTFKSQVIQETVIEEEFEESNEEEEEEEEEDKSEEEPKEEDKKEVKQK